MASFVIIYTKLDKFGEFSTKLSRVSEDDQIWDVDKFSDRFLTPRRLEKMGCISSSTKEDNERDKPASNALNNADNNVQVELDPRLELNKRQHYLLKANWKAIRRDIRLVGVKLFVQLFMTNNELFILFPKFVGLENPTVQRASEVFQDHGEKVMEKIDEVVQNLDELDDAIRILHEVGAYHRTHQGFKPEFFRMAEKPFLAAVESTLGERYTPNMENIYTVIAAFLINTLIEGYNGNV